MGAVSSGFVAQPSKPDFCVVASEEAQSVPTSIRPDSSSQVHNNVEYQKLKSNPSAVVGKEDDDSTDFVNFQLKDIGETEVNHTDSKNPERSTELAVLHNKLNCPDCFQIGSDDSRSIFDRGKYFGNLILSFGFKSDFGFLYLITPLCVRDTENFVDGKLLAKMPEAVTWNLGNDRDDFLLQLQQGKMLIKMLPMDMCVLSTNFFLNHTLHTRMSFSRCFKYVAIVFDRGKGFDRSISMKYYNGKFDHRLISMHGFESDFSFCASILLVFVTNGASDESGKLFAKFSQGNSFPMNTSLFEGMLMCEITNVHELSHQMLEMWEEGIFLFQLKYVFPKALIGCQFVYWGDLGDSSKMHAEFSARSIFFFLLLARVLCFQKARQYLVQVLGWKGAENYSLQLTCDLLEAIVAQFLFLLPTSAGFFRVELFRVIIARQTCDMHPILLQELRTLLSLKHCPLLTSATYGRIMIQEGFKQFILSSLHTSYCSCEFCIFGKGLYVHYSLPAPNIYNSYMMPVGIILGTQILVVGFQLLKMLLWVGYLRWKFILVPPALLVRWIDNSFLSVVCLDEKWNYIRNLFCKAEVHNQIATTLMRSNVLLTSLLNFRSKSFNVVYLVVLQNFDKFVENDKGWIYMVGRSEVQGINSVPMLVDEQPPDQSLVEVYVHYNLQKNCQWIDGLNFEVCKVITEIFIGLAKFLDSSSSFVFDRGKVFSNHMWGFRYSTIKIANWTELGINILVHGVLYTDDIMEIHVVVLATTNDASSGILVSAY